MEDFTKLRSANIQRPIETTPVLRFFFFSLLRFFFFFVPTQRKKEMKRKGKESGKHRAVS
jgi:hypothetical protein